MPQPTQPVQQPEYMTGVNGEQFQVVNNHDFTPKSNIENQPTQPVQQSNPVSQNFSPSQPAQQPQNANYYNVGVGREQEIINNIGEGIKNDGRVQQAINSGDFDAFKKIYGYETADGTKRKILEDQWAASTRHDSDSLFQGILSGRTFAQNIQNSPDYARAKIRATNYQKYSNASVGELAQYLRSGDLLQGSQTYTDLLNSPQAAQKLREARVYAGNNYSPNLENISSKTNSEIAQSSPATKSMFDDGVITPEEYDQALQTPAITEKMKDVETKKNKYDKLKAEWDEIENDVNKDSRYSGLSATGKRALMADRQKGIRMQLQIAADEYNNGLGTLTEMKKTQANILEMNFAMYKDQKAFAQQKELAQFNADLSLKTSQREFEQKLQQQQQMANDPYTAINQMVDEYKKLGVPMQRSVQQMVADYQASGKDLATYLTELNKTIQTKPEWQAIQQANLQKLNPTEYRDFGGQVYKIQNGQLVPTGISTDKDKF